MSVKLGDNAILVQLSVSQWTARKQDKQATSKMLAAARAKTGTGKVHKTLLPMNTSLERLHQKTTEIRTKFYKNTLPWGLGTQLLPNKNYLSFTAEFRQLSGEWQSLRSAFLQDYRTLDHTQLQAEMGDLYNPRDYPTSYEVADKFQLTMDFYPVPDNDFRTALPENELAAIQQSIELRVKDAVATAMTDVWQRLAENVQHVVEKLSDPSAIFRDTLIENVKETCDLLTRLNVTDDPNLEQVRSEVERKLASLHPDRLRFDPDLRKTKAAEAKEIMARMGAFMGGVK